MKRAIFIAALFCAATAWGQQPNIEINQRGNELAVERTGWGTFTVNVTVVAQAGVMNYRFPVTEPKVNIVLTDMPNEISSISWDWLQAAVDSGADTTFVYQLPFKGCKKATVHALANYDLGIYRGFFRNFRVWQFDLSQGREIYPMRAGQVIRVDEEDIVVEHADGSQAVYSLVADVAVVEGQQITTKTKLGVAGTLPEQSQYMIRVALYYYESATNQMIPSIFARKVYIDPLFKHGHLKNGSKIRN